MKGAGGHGALRPACHRLWTRLSAFAFPVATINNKYGLLLRVSRRPLFTLRWLGGAVISQSERQCEGLKP